MSSENLARWKNLLELRRPDEYQPNHVLFRQEAEAHNVYLIEAGFVNLKIDDPITGLERAILWRSPGQFVGDSSAMLGCTSPVKAITATRSLLHRIPAGRFRQILNSNKESPHWIFAQTLNRDLLNLMRGMSVTASKQARKRLEYVLWQLTVQQHGPGVIGSVTLAEYTPRNHELSGYIGVSPTYISTLFQDLRREGIAHRDGPLVVVSQPQKLFRPPDTHVNMSEKTAQWKRLLDFGSPRTIEPDSILFREHEDVEDVYLIDKGFVDMSAETENGRTTTEQSLFWCSAGQLAGDSSALLNFKSPVTARSKTNSRLYRVSRDRFVDGLHADSRSALWQFTTVQIEERLALVMFAKAMHLQPLKNKLEYVLWLLSQQAYPGRQEDEIRLTGFSPDNETLAGYIGTEERYLIALMKDLRQGRAAWRSRDKILTLREPWRLFHFPAVDPVSKMARN